MAQRSSRSKKTKGRGRGGETRKQPELRTGGGRRAKAQRARERERSGEREATSSVKLRVRRAGAVGYAVVVLLAWLVVAAVVVAGWKLGQAWVLSYPDSAWLYALIGAIAVAPAVGSVARERWESDSWGVQALLGPVALLVVERVLGPGCPQGGDCAAIGARGSLGVVATVVVLVVGAFAAWALARWFWRRASEKRPTHGRVGHRFAIVAMVLTAVFVGGPVAVALGGLDYLLRPAPRLADQARLEVALHCFGIGAEPDVDDLAVRPAPDGIQQGWTSFAVRRVDEDRPGVGGKDLPTRWARQGGLHPYEAHVSFDGEGTALAPSCRRIDPATGNAVATDLEQPDLSASNPLNPQQGAGADFFPSFYTQGPKEPEPAAKPKATAKATAG